MNCYLLQSHLSVLVDLSRLHLPDKKDAMKSLFEARFFAAYNQFFSLYPFLPEPPVYGKRFSPWSGHLERSSCLIMFDYLWPRVKKVSIAYIAINSTMYILHINNQMKITDFQNDTLGSTRRESV